MEPGPVALITGAAGQVGRATLSVLRSDGWRCVLLDRDEDALARLARDQDPSAVGSAFLDVTSARSVDAAVADAAARFGRLDAAVLAAGLEGPVGPVEDCPEDAFDAVMATNVKGVWLLLKACLPRFKAQGSGSIVALSSISGLGAAPLLAAYGASKHAVLGLVRASAREAAGHGVRVNAVCPGPIESEMMARIDRGLAERLPSRLADGRSAAESIPLRRYARAEEVARLIAFLCSDASSYCTGGSFTVDGGYMAR